MGSASSKTISNTENNQTYISKNSMKTLNELTNTAVANALIENDNSCANFTNIHQKIDLSGCKAKNITIGGSKQEINAQINFSCVNAFNAEQKMAQDILSTLTGEIMNKMDVAAVNAMTTKAETKATNAGIFSGDSNSNSDIHNEFNLISVNDTNTDIQNIIASNVNTNFNVESVQECVNEMNVSQELLLSGCNVDGDITITDFSQNASISNMAECINKSGTVQDIISKTANDLGVIAVNDSEIRSTSTITNDITTTAESLGLGSCASCAGSCPGGSGTCLIIMVICCLLLLSLGGGGFAYYQANPEQFQ